MKSTEEDYPEAPEASIINSEGGFPLVEDEYNNSIQYGWNDLADAVSKYGIPMVFNIRILPSVVNATKNLIYVNIIFLLIVYVLDIFL